MIPLLGNSQESLRKIEIKGATYILVPLEDGRVLLNIGLDLKSAKQMLSIYKQRSEEDALYIESLESLTSGYEREIEQRKLIESEQNSVIETQEILLNNKDTIINNKEEIITILERKNKLNQNFLKSNFFLKFLTQITLGFLHKNHR